VLHGTTALQQICPVIYIRRALYAVHVLPLRSLECYKLVAKEIGNAYKCYDGITPANSKSLLYLYAYLEEFLCIPPRVNTKLLRVSPGAVVDGQYGVRVSLPLHVSPFFPLSAYKTPIVYLPQPTRV
jgi:hypothetical protein